MPATIVLTGRLAFDPEVRQTRGGDTVCNFKVPVDTGWGERKVTTWYRVTVFGKRAETAGKHLSKGKWVSVTGEVAVETWQRKDGSGEGWTATVKAHSWDFVGAKDSSSPARDSSSPATDSNADRIPSADRRYSEVSLDDLPF